MHKQVGNLLIKNGIAKRGLLVRHLLLPNDLSDSEKIYEFLVKEISPNTYLNLMDQYYPSFNALKINGLNRRITEKEFNDNVLIAKKKWPKTFRP